MDWRTTERAEADLAEIEIYGTRTYGRRRAQDYVDDLFAALSALAGNPRIVRERPEIAPGLRLYRFRAHYVLYRIDDEGVLVLSIMGARQEFKEYL